MGASAIADGIVANLESASAFGASAAATHYRILETTAGSCCVVGWTGLSEVEAAFIGSDNLVDATWTHTIEIYIKDTGNPIEVNNRMLSGIDTALVSIRSDKTIQGTVERIIAIRANRELPDAGLFEAAGHSWHRMIMEVDSIEWPND